MAVHCRVFAPSAVMSSALGQPVVSLGGSPNSHRMVTLLVYQPFEPAVPTSVDLTRSAAAFPMGAKRASRPSPATISWRRAMPEQHRASERDEQQRDPSYR